MKPRKLKIKGLNSFKEEQIIDFERLTEKGFFGIFGPTGCGKSSILDAITYALYGKIIRDNTGFINVSEETVEISYEFEIGVGKERKIFVVDRAAKKDVKKGGYKSTVTRLMEREEDNFIVLADKKSEVDNYVMQIIGLTMDDFTRAVVLPQGKFSEFLKTAPSDRRDMLERIFALQKYGRGLGDKIKAASRENKEQLSVLSGKLSQYEGVSEEALLKLKEELEVIIKEEKALAEEKLSLDEQFEMYKVIWQLQQELKLHEEKLMLLLHKHQEVCSEKHRVERGRASLQVKPFIDNLKENDKKLRDNEVELMNLAEALKQLYEKLKLTEKRHAEALEKKDKNIPRLVAKEENLKQAIELEALKKGREEERVLLVEQYKKVKGEKKSIEEALKEMVLQREEKNLKLLEIEKSINNNKVEPEYREKLNAAYIKEMDYRKSVKYKTELEDKIKLLTEVLDKEKASLEECLKKQNIKNEEIEKYKVMLEALEKSCPGDNTLLFDRMEFINKLKKYCGDSKENENKCKQLTAKLKPVEKQYMDIANNLELYNKELLQVEGKIEKINGELDRIKNNNLASILASKLIEGDSCPVCGANHFVHLAEPIDEAELNEYENKRLELEASKEKIKNEIQNMELKKVGFEIELKHINTELKLVQEKAEEIRENVKSLNLQFKDAADLENLSINNEKEFDELKSSVDKWNKELQKLEQTLNVLKEEKNIIDGDAARLSEGIKKDIKNIEAIKDEFERATNEFKEAEAEYTRLKGELAVDDIEERYNGLSELDKIMKKLQVEEKDLRDFIFKIDKEKAEKEEANYKLAQEEAKISQSGLEKKNAIEDYEKQIAKLSQGKEPKVHILEVQKEIKLINDEEAYLKRELEEERLKMQGLEQKKAASEKNMETLTKLKEEQGVKLKNSLIENGFKDIEEAESCFITVSVLEAKEREIKSYEEQLSNGKNTVENIKDKLKGQKLQEEEWLQLQENRDVKGNLLKEKIEVKIKKGKELSDMEESLSKIKELAKEQKELEHKESLLKELEKLVQGNKLVEFVATSQLKYVAAEASKRLKDITRGRYALELDDSGSFVMRDDFNGGLRRSTNSLSGGETFLTSLALALALSSQIQLKGRTPLEFFFLDEGFGTLDNELLDTVMTSLESLRSDRLCVGIISHVEEIKNRVPIKLIVSPASIGEGTKIVIEKS